MEHIIKQIVIEVFEKAKIGSSSQRPTALSNFIDEKTDRKIKSRTARRAYKRYIELDDEIGAPIPETVKNFCRFLNYNDYEDYVKKNELNKLEPKEPKTEIKLLDSPKENAKEEEEEEEEEEEDGDDGEIGDDGDDEKEGEKWLWIVATCLLTFLIIFFYNDLTRIQVNKKNESPVECMAWANNKYEKIDCNLQFHPKYGTKVESLLPERKKVMKKIEVNAATHFFSEETRRPLIWYYKDKNENLEYFTSPGFHPVNGETLKKITPGIIQKHVPTHKMNSNSFIQNTSAIEKTNPIITSSATLGIAIFNKIGFDERVSSKVIETYFKGNPSSIYLNDKKLFDADQLKSSSLIKTLKTELTDIEIDTLCLGFTNYRFLKSKMSKDRVNCTLYLKLEIYTKEGRSWTKIKDESIERTGTGYSQDEAKSNTINKINYE